MEGNSGKVKDAQSKDSCEEGYPELGKETCLKADLAKVQCGEWLNRPTPEIVQRLIVRLLDKSK